MWWSVIGQTFCQFQRKLLIFSFFFFTISSLKIKASYWCIEQCLKTVGMDVATPMLSGSLILFFCGCKSAYNKWMPVWQYGRMLVFPVAFKGTASPPKNTLGPRSLFLLDCHTKKTSLKQLMTVMCCLYKKKAKVLLLCLSSLCLAASCL